jgi:hypothetical protein
LQLPLNQQPIELDFIRQNDLIMEPMMSNEMPFSTLFSLLPLEENAEYSSIEGTSFVIHEDHRWLLPIANFAQQRGLLPKPCTLVMFDAHEDSVELTCLELLAKARADLTSERLVEICRNELRKLDDDWIKAGMELAIFKDAIIFGGWHNDRGIPKPDTYTASANSESHRFIKSGLPLHALAYQGELSDHARTTKLQHLWNALGWQPDGGVGVFDFVPGLPPILLSLDLDCFAASWRGYNFPWPDEIFETEFLEPSKYSSTLGWTGKRFLNALIHKAGLVAFAREAECTDGPAKARHILQRLNHYVFEGELPSEWYS